MDLRERADRLRQYQKAAKLDPRDPKDLLLSELTDAVSELCLRLGAQEAVADGLSQTLEELQELLDYADEELLDEDGDVLGVEEYFDGTEHGMYQVKCPRCGETLVVDERSMQRGFDCPGCGERLIQAEE